MRTGLVLSLLLAIIAVVFALLNPQPMEVDLLFFSTEGSTALVLILTFGLGVTVGLLSSLPGRLRARRQLKALQKQQKASPSSSTPASSSEGKNGASS
jgi:putative membrane protein